MRFFFRYPAWAIVVFLLGFFFVAEIGTSSTRTVETDFVRSNRSFSAIGPPTRVDGYDQKRAALRIVGEPVYVDVRVPRLAKAITVTLWGGNDDSISPAIGIEQDSTIVALTPLVQESFEDGYERSSAMLDLSGLKKTDGAIRLVLSLPFEMKRGNAATASAPFFLHRLQVVTERPTVAQLIRKLWNK